LRSLHDADQQISQTLAPGRLLELFQDPRIIAAAATNPTATPKKGLSAANQEETLPSELLVGFLFMLFSQAFKGGHLTKPEMFSANALGAVHNCCAIDARLRLRLLGRNRRGGALSQRFETRIVA
jgi:hypothetical protein